MADTSNRSRIAAETFARPARLEALTLRCERDARRRIEAAFERERRGRPKLSLGRFLAECVANGLPENLPSAAVSGVDPETIAIRVADEISEHMAGLMTAVPVIADVLGDLAQKFATLDQMVAATGRDAARIRELVEGAVGDESAGSTGGETIG
jgi:hypothetical protein